MNHKLDILKKVAQILNEHHVLWHLGASCMLYFRGYVDHFDDIDLMIHLKDIDLVKKILSMYPYEERKENAHYKTEVFLEYTIEGVEIDLMAGFAIVSDRKVYYFPLKEEDPFDEVLFDDTVIYLSKVDTWLNYYRLMNREDKVHIIEEHLMKKSGH